MQLLPVVICLSATAFLSSFIHLPLHIISNGMNSGWIQSENICPQIPDYKIIVSDNDGCFSYGRLSNHKLESDTLSIYFAGDLMQHEAQIKSARTSAGSYDYSSIFKYVKDEIRKADIAVGNLEVTMGGLPYTGYPAFSAPDEYLYAINEAGFDVLLTANNHCLDRGRKGLERTIGMLDSLRIYRAGTYVDNSDRIHNYPLLVEKKGFKIVFLNFTYGTNGIKVSSPNVVNYIDKDQIKKDILKARLMRPDVIIACVHWGVEYKTIPNKEQTDLAEWLVKMGVNHVIGSHPHVVQPITVLEKNPTPDKSFIAYSLGNYISNMSAPQTDGGLSVTIKLKKTEGKTRLIDYKYSFVWTSRPLLNKKEKFYIVPEYLDEKFLNEIEVNRRKLYVEKASKIVNLYLDE